MGFKVSEIIDGETFIVTPKWMWEDDSGEIVRALGYNAPEAGKPGHEEAKEKLKTKILGRTVELRNPIHLFHGRLLCDVFIDGKNLADYFPEYF